MVGKLGHCQTRKHDKFQPEARCFLYPLSSGERSCLLLVFFSSFFCLLEERHDKKSTVNKWSSLLKTWNLSVCSVGNKLKMDIPFLPDLLTNMGRLVPLAWEI